MEPWYDLYIVYEIYLLQNNNANTYINEKGINHTWQMKIDESKILCLFCLATMSEK